MATAICDVHNIMMHGAFIGFLVGAFITRLFSLFETGYPPESQKE